ncbi:hypothetical protein [Vallitalea guaymasensis]|uniref:hypothetical protein n=1 Tax=Vallitalea guaymasensis TaxID=1185412 RepID=UPI000DE4C104|nr:hypothetical protein [Vallitalea guaymasensis]
MSNQKIFIEESKEWRKVGNSMSTEYRTNPKGDFIIRWKGREKTCPYRVGDFICVSCKGNFPTVSRIRYPKQPGRFIAWLFGYYGEKNCHSKDEAIKRLIEKRRYFEWINYEEYVYETEHAFVVQCNRMDCGGVYNIVCYIDNNITKEEINDLFYNNFRYNRSENMWNIVHSILPQLEKSNFLEHTGNYIGNYGEKYQYYKAEFSSDIPYEEIDGSDIFLARDNNQAIKKVFELEETYGYPKELFILDNEKKIVYDINNALKNALFKRITK